MLADSSESVLIEECFGVLRSEVGEYGWRHPQMLRDALVEGGASVSVVDSVVDVLLGETSALSVVPRELEASGLFRFLQLAVTQEEGSREGLAVLRNADFSRWPTTARDSAARILSAAGEWKLSLLASEPLVKDLSWPPNFLLVRLEPHYRVGSLEDALSELCGVLSGKDLVAAGSALAIETAWYLSRLVGLEHCDSTIERAYGVLRARWTDWADESWAVLVMALIGAHYDFAEEVWRRTAAAIPAFRLQWLASLRRRLSSFDSEELRIRAEWLSRVDAP